MEITELLARESIRDTMARYSIAGDEFDVDAYLACFIEDGIMEFAEFPGQGHVLLEGKAAIRKFVEGFFGALKSGKSAVPGKFMRHHLTSSRVDFEDADNATAKTYALYADDSGVNTSGIYTDRFRKVGERWLIARRKWAVDR